MNSDIFLTVRGGGGSQRALMNIGFCVSELWAFEQPNLQLNQLIQYIAERIVNCAKRMSGGRKWLSFVVGAGLQNPVHGDRRRLPVAANEHAVATSFFYCNDEDSSLHSFLYPISSNTDHGIQSQRMKLKRVEKTACLRKDNTIRTWERWGCGLKNSRCNNHWLSSGYGVLASIYGSNHEHVHVCLPNSCLLPSQSFHKCIETLSVGFLLAVIAR